MTTNRGTFEGDIQEIEFVKVFNKDKQNVNFSIFTNNINYDLNKVYMVRVTTNQLSRLSGKITKTRSDCYAIYCEDEQITTILQEILKEDNIEKHIQYRQPQCNYNVFGQPITKEESFIQDCNAVIVAISKSILEDKIKDEFKNQLNPNIRNYAEWVEYYKNILKRQRS